MEEKIEIVVLKVKGKTKGIMSYNSFKNFKGKVWWDEVKIKTVPLRDYLTEKINATNIDLYQFTFI